MVARSSTESEYRFLPQTAAEVSWVQAFLRELRLCPTIVPIIWCDNTNALSLAQNPVFHSQCKHVELDVHFVRVKVLKKSIDVRYVPSSEQLADALTKLLSETQFSLLRGKLGVLPSPSRLRGMLGRRFIRQRLIASVYGK